VQVTGCDCVCAFLACVRVGGCAWGPPRRQLHVIFVRLCNTRNFMIKGMGMQVSGRDSVCTVLACVRVLGEGSM